MSSISETFLEGLSTQVEVMQPVMGSGMFQYIHPTAAQDWTRDELGRNWQIIKTWELGVAGAFSFANVNGPDMANHGNAVSYKGFSGVQTYPGLSRSVITSTVRRTITLKKLIGSIMMPATIVRATQLSKSFQDYAQRAFNGAARNLSALITNSFFAERDSTGVYRGVIGTVTTPAGAPVISSTGLQVTLKGDGSAIRRFFNLGGMQYDIFPTGSNVRVNTEPAFIDKVDAIGTSAAPITEGGTMYLFHLGATTTALAPATDYHLVPRDSGRENAGAVLMPTPMLDIFKDTGDIADWGISVDDYPQLKTIIRDLDGAAITPTYLLALVGHIQDIFGTEDMADSIWARRGVWATYLADKDGQFSIERNGAILRVKDGVADGSSYTLDGTNLLFKSDPWLPEKSMFGLKMGNRNWQKVMPPKLPGTGTAAPFLGGVEFIGPYLYGGGDIFVPYMQRGGAEAGALTDQRQAPLEYSYEIIPDQMYGSFWLKNAAQLIK